MSTFRAVQLGTRVALIHDMPDMVTVSEMDLVQADILLEQMQRAKEVILTNMRKEHSHE